MTFDTVFQIGRTIQGENLYWDVLHRQPPLYVCAKKESSRAPGIQQYVQWVDQLFEFRGEIYLRDDLVQPPPVLPGSAKKGSAKAARTARARDARFVAHACLRCGAFHHRAREEKPQFKPEDCPRESTDNRGSSRSTHRLWRKQCCSFIDELPTETTP